MYNNLYFKTTNDFKIKQGQGGSMKKVLIFVVILLVIHGLSRGNILKLMGGVSSVTNTVFDGKYNSTMGLFGGFGIEPSIGKIRIENIYVVSTKAHKFEFKNKARLYQFLTITSDLGVKFRFAKDSSPYLFLGGFLSYISYQRKGFGGKDLDAPNEHFFDYGIAAGIGIEFIFTGLAVTLEGRYRRGMAYLEIEDMTFRTREYSALLGIRIFSKSDEQ